MSKEKMVMQVRAYPIAKNENGLLANATVNIGTKDGNLIAINHVKLREVKKDDQTYTFVDLPKRQLKDREGNALKDENGHNQYAEYVSFNVDEERHVGQAEKIRNLVTNEVRKAFNNCKEGMQYGESERETDFEIDPDKVSAYVKSENSPASVYIGDIMRIDNIFVNEKDNNKYLSMPHEKYEKDGEVKYRNYVSPVKEGLNNKILDAIEQARTRVQDKAQGEETKSEEQEKNELEM